MPDNEQQGSEAIIQLQESLAKQVEVSIHFILEKDIFLKMSLLRGLNLITYVDLCKNVFFLFN